MSQLRFESFIILFQISFLIASDKNLLFCQMQIKRLSFCAHFRLNTVFKGVTFNIILSSHKFFVLVKHVPVKGTVHGSPVSY